MFTEPKIVTSNDLKQRSYVTFYIDNERIREYNGNSLNMRITPNRAKSLRERNEQLHKLQVELHRALIVGNYPVVRQPEQNNLLQPDPLKKSAQLLLAEALNKKLNSDLSRTYKRNLKNIHRQFTTFLQAHELEGDISAITTIRVEEFLDSFNSSGTYYMDKRRDLGVLFSSIGRAINQPLKAVRETERKRSKAKLHKAYDKDQLKPILNYLKVRYPHMHICCLLTYASWLRPHEEVRLLTKDHFRNDNSEVLLSGSENKGGKVRVVYVPDYVRLELNPILSRIERHDNIFSLRQQPFNEAYFNTQWTRAWKRMYEAGLVYKDQTLYSFRHTAAIETYRRTKDVYLLQKLLGHSTIVVTLKYLRNLGELNTQELIDAAPTL